jgi:hypothetical protein
MILQVSLHILKNTYILILFYYIVLYYIFIYIHIYIYIYPYTYPQTIQKTYFVPIPITASSPVRRRPTPHLRVTAAAAAVVAQLAAVGAWGRKKGPRCPRGGSKIVGKA